MIQTEIQSLSGLPGRKSPLSQTPDSQLNSASHLGLKKTIELNKSYNRFFVRKTSMKQIVEGSNVTLLENTDAD